MSTPSPVFPPPGPVQADYPLSALNLFPANAPFVPFTVFRGDIAPKLWSDPTGVPGQIKTYGHYNPATGAWQDFTMDGAAAFATNVPGVPGTPMYRPYVVAPTSATWVSTVGFATIAVQAGDLSTKDQADAIAAAWGPGATVSLLTEEDNATFTPNGETRGVYVINWNGEQINVGSLLLLMYANGIGAPGSWVGINTTPLQQPTWSGGGNYLYPVPNSAGPIPQMQAPAGWKVAPTGLGQYAVVKDKGKEHK